MIGRRKSAVKVGLPPGSMVYTGEQKLFPVTIELTTYNTETISHLENIQPEQLSRKPTRGKVQWYRILGIHDVHLLRQLGERLKIDSLVLEDIINTSQRPKLEDYEDYIFITFKSITVENTSGEFKMEQLSMLLFNDVLLTFHEGDRSLVNPMLKRLEQLKSRARQRNADYLFYALLDLTVDHYLASLEMFEEKYEQLEYEVSVEPEQKQVEHIQNLKRELFNIRRVIRPFREAINALYKEEFDQIEESTKIFIRDLNDHMLQVTDSLEHQRELVSGLMDTYLSNVSNRMNEVMKVLTIIATLFIPVTFFAGIYGMNFEYMPELGWKYSYPVFWLIVLVVFGGLITFFKRRKWL